MAPITLPTTPRLRAPMLVADPEPEFLERLRVDSGEGRASPVLAATHAEAQRHIADRNTHFSGIFINPAISEGGGLALVRLAHQARAGTPVFLLYEEKEAALPREQLTRAAIHEALRKPVVYADLVSLIAPILRAFDPQTALRAAARNPDPLGALSTAQDSDFVPVRADHFISGSRSFFDLYVRLASGRYLKLIQAGDAFAPERLIVYLNKGVSHFHIRKEAQAAYVSYCDHLATQLASVQRAPVALKATQTLHFGEQTLRFLADCGITGVRLEHASRFAADAQHLARELRLDAHPMTEGFMRDLATYEHGVAATIVAALLVDALGLRSERLQKLVGVSALLHDIGMFQIKRTFKIGEDADLTDEGTLIFRSHPMVGAQILAQVRGIDPAVVQAVAHHHERRDGKGFPDRLGAGKISRIAEIVGLSDEFTRLLARSIKDPGVNVFREMHLRVFDGYSSALVDQFCMTFVRKPTS